MININAVNIGSTSIYFNTVCLTIVAAIFMALIIIVYLKKDKIKSLTTKLFVIEIILNVSCIIMEFFMSFAAMSVIKDYLPNNTLATIICKLYVFIAILWDSIFFLYVLVLIYKFDFFYNSEKNRFNKKAIPIFGGLVLFAGLFVYFFDIEFLGGVNNSPYTIGGTLKILYDLYTIIGSAFCNTLFALYYKKVKNMNVWPYVLLYTFYLVIVGLCYFSNYYFNHLAFISSLIMLATFFTIESQDSKLVQYYKKSKLDAEKANRAKTEFLINMSHQIRTPMNTILGFSETLENDTNLNEETLKKDMDSVNSASNILADLIDDILEISQIESGNEQINETDYTLENLMFEINSLIPSKIYKDELKFSIEVDQSIPRAYHGDINKIFKVITYVILNAIEYTNYGEVKLVVNGNRVENGFFEFNFLVKNTGHAMSYETFERNFDDFVNIENAQSNNIDNIKLGIIIAKQLTNMLNGKIDFINEKGQGTRYNIIIRQKIIDFNPLGNIFDGKSTVHEKVRTLIDCSDKRALIVDDADVNLKLASRYLEQYRFMIDVAKNGKECVELVKSKKYDIIFLDKMMPEMDGIATIKALNALGTSLPPIVALTANSFDNSSKTYLEEGYSEYLNKPIVFRELNKIIHKFFGNDETGGVIR